MAKRLKADESGDNDELQALFDSIAGQAQEDVSKSAVQTVAPVVDEVGDSAELQALFDSVAGGVTATGAATEEGAVNIKEAVAATANKSFEERQAQAFLQIGQLTRLLHDTIRQLGYDKMLEETAEKLPDARQRLSYISQMTEQAASRVLNATDIAKPIQDRFESESQQLSERWAELYDSKLSVAEFKELAAQTRAFLDRSVKDSQVVNEQLLEIMMAQDFQDLTGQVIKKIVEMATKMENGLLKVLIEIMPESKRSLAEDGLLNGPVVNAGGREDVVTSQEQVDDLLDSLGF
ncbi:MAG: protein phosphatase CheZ [Candidatus Dactylopiibacterium carminicum]|uniref:Protein phosphatase CheZ n=1 Tax=Candidatus Dactylopiibacterium carminicum TaxID=857335 RepID=A0A272ERT6_9RHOO|nr:protein phosphatase CheZ [Candidatus Dactylopiibacterium carminicum]KAF7598899.1 protein phosphatase CheZ [Candidatus Dactylopiibacterium carminicum]PAS92802.1 MAG: protein phosphatase CheZ [Candidatus Dactylopiibacterium carminicum]PAS96254.1 MAG: protein phosphatase CheZ [Candidatus Dactylopiibacterium carminicum]PAS98917.1 MAG: protein phosphatase CheZ [Candidatus Dactylopiibacterium carminicum]